MSSSSDYIPSEIWREILVRLPAESLFRFRAVSKGWRAVIDDPCFVRSHTNSLPQQLSSKILIQKRMQISSIKEFRMSFYSLDLEALIGCSSGHQAISAVPLDLNVIIDGRANFSSCNGLILTKEFPVFTIWNPLTHERLELPPGDFSYVQAFGLGYDSTTDDYKAVVILCCEETHVYSLRADSGRSITNCPCDGDWLGLFGPGVFVCGALNWLLAREELGVYDKIVSLDLGNEKYSLLQIPQGSDRLIVLGGRLAVCENCKSHLNVWVRDEDSWFKLYSIENEQNNFSGFFMPSAFSVNEKLVFLQDDDRRFFVFDVETKSLKCVEFNGSVIKEDSYVWAQQMFVGTIFCLNANCGGGGRTRCTKKKKKKKKKKKARDLELVFCIRDANGEYNDSCSKRGCGLSAENEESEDYFSWEDVNQEWLYL